MYYGDFHGSSETIHIKFTTTNFATGGPATFAGAVTVFKGDSVTQDTSTAALLTTNFDSNVGLNHVRIIAGVDTAFYTPLTDYSVTIAGTVGTVSISGYYIGGFSIANRSAVRAAVKARWVQTDANGYASLNWSDVTGTTASVTLTGTHINSVIDATGYELSSTGSTQLLEDYATVSVAPTLNQAVYMILQLLQNRSISGTTLTVKKLGNQSTTAMTYTLDSATVPTSQVRAT